jgi:hypothetical protein
LFMTVRGEIAEPRREIGARAVRPRCILVQYGEGLRGEPVGRRLVVAVGSAIAAEAFMNNAGEEGISEGFRLAKSERAVPGGV